MRRALRNIIAVAAMTIPLAGTAPLAAPLAANASTTAAGAAPVVRTGSTAGADATRPATSRVLGNFSVPYSHSWKWVSPTVRGINKCVTLTASGRITYTVTLNAGPRISTLTWSRQVLRAPELQAVVRPHSCTGPATLTGAIIAQHWTGFSCSYNPSISVSAPFGVSLGGWPSCGTRRQATYTSNFRTQRAPAYTQFNSASSTSFGNFSELLGANKPPCYGVFVSMQGFVNTTTDSFGDGSQGDNSARVCLSKT